MSTTKKRKLSQEPIPLANKKKRESEKNPMGPAISENEIELEESIVGTGTFSKVYKGYYKRYVVAVKVFKPRVLDEDFVKEVSTLRQLCNDKIVKFFGYTLGEEKKIVLEFMERGTLFDVLHKELQEFNWQEKLQIIKQVSSGMKYLHSMKIAHCDLSSKNLLVGKAMEIKISDFGQCERFDLPPTVLDGKLRGTLRWMSKEILLKESTALDKCDVWSFGVIMFEIGSSTIPYWDLTDTDVRSEIKRGAWPTAKDFSIWMTQKTSNKWKLLMDLCFQVPAHRPSFEILDLDISLLDGIWKENKSKYKK
jgi:serine/threonine protein kinase